MSTTLEPPTRPYAAAGASLEASLSARSSTTHIEMHEDGNNATNTEPPTTNHPMSNVHDGASVLGASEPKSASSAEQPAPAPDHPVPQTPQTHLTFLVISGRRRTMSFEPETTVGRVKELVWNAWPTEWEDERPMAPSYLRILYLGKMLQDDDTLTKLKFPTHLPQSTPAPTPTIVHLSIRPIPPAGEGDLKKKRGRGRNTDSGAQDTASPPTEDSGAGSCCCIIC
ncbi:ubiquitin-related domain-containing protein [Collybia nuda]|uniref:Ubiquitin-related domain-containing protein n=1 Tax=Collybia nuda TaxID=64659 RepID=A0A9P5XY37_9AGAR|nr:ubiquitin-related domain-containing protein [Collybia nuda]